MGWQEILIVIILAIFFIRPKDMPAFLHKCGQLVGQIKNFWHETFDDIDRTQHNISILEQEKERKNKGE